MIKEVVLRRFKRFEEEPFDLSGHVILAGPNNCGKTTVLQAITAWGLAFRHWRAATEQRSEAERKPAREFVHKPRGLYEWVPIARQAFSAVPLRSFDLLWKERRYEGLVEIGVRTIDGNRITFELQADSTEQIKVRPKKEVSADVLLGRIPSVVYVATVGGLSVEEPVYQSDYIETLLGRQRPGDVVRNLLLQASRGQEWDRLKAAVQRLFGVDLLVPQTPGGQIVCEYRQREGLPSFDILSAGSGFQQVVLLLACLFTRRGSVVLVDEPDAHLHVFLQDTIFAELGKAAAETSSQLVLATHSEVIFNSAAPEQICLMMGKPRRLASATDVQKLRRAVAVLQQSDLVQALEAPGILYLEGYTDLNLLRAWARVLAHPLQDYFNRTPFWRGKQPPLRADAAEVPASEHFNALRLVNENLTGIWFIDADGKRVVPSSGQPEYAKLNRLCWSRYEAESYLVHPTALARFIDRQAGGGGAEAVKRFLTQAFEKYVGAGLGAQIADSFIGNPLQPSQIVERYLAETKARTLIVGASLQEGGVHGMDYTRFNEIAGIMEQSEIHPEVKEKLDFIQKAFGL
jgi:ABC-type nitrate/sulfonate/bicarbonate transport system ATPase subunit